MKMEQTECSKTSAYKIQTPGNYPEESIQQYLYYHLFHMFRYICIILRYFQSFTLLKLRSFCVIKIALKII